MASLPARMALGNQNIGQAGRDIDADADADADADDANDAVDPSRTPSRTNPPELAELNPLTVPKTTSRPQPAARRRKTKRDEKRDTETVEDRCTRTRLVCAALELLWSCSYGATSVDAICEKAGARKGSFYYFFPSKSALAIEALEEHWRRRSVVLDDFFAPTIPPLQRLKRYFADVRKQQAEYKEKHGIVLGCPLFSVGCEICTQDRAIADRVQGLLERYIAYFERVIADAAAGGLINVPDVTARAHVVFSYYEGVLAQARIQNSLAPLAALEKGVAALLGGASAHELLTD